MDLPPFFVILFNKLYHLLVDNNDYYALCKLLFEKMRWL